MKKLSTTIAMLACLAMVGLGVALAQAPEHLENALKNTAAHDQIRNNFV